MASSGEYYDADRPAMVAPGAAAPGSGQAAGSFFNLASIRAFFWRQRYILIGVTSLVFIAGLIYTLLLPPTYSAVATMRIQASDSMLIQGQEVTDPGIPTRETERYIRSLISIMTSRNMAFRVVDELGLQDNPAVIGEEFEGAQDESTEEVRRQIAAGVVASSIAVEVPLNTDVVLVRFESGDPVVAARVANAYVDTFMEDAARQGAGTNTYSLSYLEEQIQEVRGRLLDAERSALAYARENRIVGDPITAPAPFDPATGQGGTSSPVSVSNLASVNQTYTSARAARIAAEQVWRAAAPVPATELPAVQQSGVIQSLRARQTALETTRSDLQQRYRDDYPQIRELNAQIEEIDRQIVDAAGDIKNAIRDNYQIALRQEQALNAELERVSTATLDEQDRRVQYNIMDRDAQALQAQLAALLNRYNQVSSAANLESQNVTWLDRALVPVEPSSPDVLLNLLMSFLLGAALATGIAVLRETFDDRVRTADEMERKLNLPALGRTPYVSEEIPEEIEDPFSPISEAYASIRATLDHAVRRDHPVIQLTSSEAGEGKTTSAVALARKYASTGRKVLLVDLDLRRPGLAKMFGDGRPEIGIVDVLYSRVPLERALLPNGIENLDVLPVGAVPDNPVEVMSSGLIAEFIERYRGQYDVTILDSSPVMGIADAPLLSRHADAVAFVVEANRAHIGKARIALRRLEDMNANLVGLILTKFRALEAGENYNYEQHYYSYNSRTA
jgi:capsular exopolysaccharide synthesis family protein